jgi:hypothetical protein
VSSYRVSVGSAPARRVKTVREAGVAVMEALTGFLADDPEAVARDAMAARNAFGAGAVEHSLTAHGRWDMSVTVNGEQIPIVIIRKRL